MCIELQEEEDDADGDVQAVSVVPLNDEGRDLYEEKRLSVSSRAITYDKWCRVRRRQILIRFPLASRTDLF